MDIIFSTLVDYKLNMMSSLFIKKARSILFKLTTRFISLPPTRHSLPEIRILETSRYDYILVAADLNNVVEAATGLMKVEDLEHPKRIVTVPCTCQYIVY